MRALQLKIKSIGSIKLCISKNSMTAITGPSGVGKTTLLRALAGFAVLQEGVVQLAKTDILQLHEKLRHEKVLFIPQGGDVLPTTVRENLSLSAINANDEQLEQALLKAQLKVDLNADATLLSGGEKQRLGIARAFYLQLLLFY